VEIVLFPSRRFRKIHFSTLQLIKMHPKKFRFYAGPRYLHVSGYLDFFRFHLPLFRFFSKSRSNRLADFIKFNDFTFIHLIEIQHAGYLFLEKHKEATLRPKVIVTNWGSDISYFSSFPEHAARISSLLKICDFYSAECRRDYKLANDFGFEGISLPLIPNSGGFERSVFDDLANPVGSKNQIYVKAYGGQFGLGNLSISAVEKLMTLDSQITCLLTSVTPDLRLSAYKLKKSFPNRVRVVTLKNPLTHSEVLQQLRLSRVYLGSSRSDGISTTFLEALVVGCYPIQTDTSCAGEWIAKGFLATTCSADQESIFRALKDSYYSLERIESAGQFNVALARKELSVEYIAPIAHQFYKDLFS
jgi:hypothetical protein